MRPFSVVTLASAVAICLAAAPRAQAGETDVSASLYGAFTGTTSANGTTQSPSNSAGGMLELRHIRNALMGLEASYSYNRANQTFSDGFTLQTVKANAHQFGAAWVVSLHVLNLTPFAEAGVAAQYVQPDGSQTGVKSEVKPVFTYGGGVDWTFFPHVGLRFQYRGNLYHAPDVARAFTSTDAFTHTAEPMIGAYLRF